MVVSFDGIDVRYACNVMTFRVDFQNSPGFSDGLSLAAGVDRELYGILYLPNYTAFEVE